MKNRLAGIICNPDQVPVLEKSLLDSVYNLTMNYSFADNLSPLLERIENYANEYYEAICLGAIELSGTDEFYDQLGSVAGHCWDVQEVVEGGFFGEYTKHVFLLKCAVVKFIELGNNYLSVG